MTTEETVPNEPDYIIIQVNCMGCHDPIERPSDADMELFRVGINVHDRPRCMELVRQRLDY